MICKGRLKQAEIRNDLIHQLLDAMNDNKHDEKKRGQLVADILYPRELDEVSRPANPEEFYEKLTTLDDNDEKLELVDLFGTLIFSIGPLSDPFARVRLLVYSLLTWFTLFDIKNTPDYCDGLIRSCRDMEKTDSFQINLSLLARTISYHNLRIGKLYHQLFRVAALLKQIPKKTVSASLTVFFGEGDRKLSRSQNVCLAMFPEHKAALEKALAETQKLNEKSEWKNWFYKIHGSKSVEISVVDTIKAFLYIYVPLCEHSMPRWTANALLLMSLININGGALNRDSADQHKSWSFALSWIETYEIPNLKNNKGLMDEISNNWEKNP